MKVAIAGLGLVGGSLARALTFAGHEVVGIDRRAASRARRAGAVAAVERDLAAAAAGVDVVVLAAPPDVNLALLEELAGSNVTITDVTSVKAPIVARAAALGLRRFVGGHPVAGRERGGFQSSDVDLFRGRSWILTPVRHTPPADLRRVRRLVRACGARPARLTAAAHDRAMAHLSHLPQLLAYALAEAAESDPVARLHLALAGRGYRDMTRLASSPRPLWREIAGQNQAALSAALRGFEAALARVRRDLGRRVRGSAVR